VAVWRKRERTEGLDLEATAPGFAGGLQLGFAVFLDLVAEADFRENGRLGGFEMGLQGSGGSLNGLHRHIVEETILHRPDDAALDVSGLRGGRGLLEEFDETVALIEDALGLGVEVGAELSERREFAVVGELALHLAGDLLEGLDLRGGTDARDGETDGDGCPD